MGAVALRKESVDRNSCFLVGCINRAVVALRKESVDRNIKVCPVVLFGVVALRKESVDRNIIKSISYLGCFRSLSARRAWIEMIGSM